MHSENIAAYIGLDVHKETLAVAIAAPERLGEVRYYGTINNEAQAVRRLFQKLQGLYGNILSCYEAGPCGFGLYHQLTAMNIKGTAPGFLESVLSVNSGCQIIVADGSIISFFCFCRRSMAQPSQQSSIVIPVHPR